MANQKSYFLYGVIGLFIVGLYLTDIYSDNRLKQSRADQRNADRKQRERDKSLYQRGFNRALKRNITDPDECYISGMPEAYQEGCVQAAINPEYEPVPDDFRPIDRGGSAYEDDILYDD